VTQLLLFPNMLSEDLPAYRTTYFPRERPNSPLPMAFHHKSYLGVKPPDAELDMGLVRRPNNPLSHMVCQRTAPEPPLHSGSSLRLCRCRFCSVNIGPGNSFLRTCRLDKNNSEHMSFFKIAAVDFPFRYLSLSSSFSRDTRVLRIVQAKAPRS